MFFVRAVRIRAWALSVDGGSVDGGDVVGAARNKIVTKWAFRTSCCPLLYKTC